MICAEERKIENVLWHPTAEGVLAVSSSNVVKIYDVAHCKEKLSKFVDIQCIHKFVILKLRKEEFKMNKKIIILVFGMA